MSDEQLRQSIRIGKGQMPAFGGLMGDEEINNLIAFIRSLAPPGTVTPGAQPAGTGGAPAVGAAAAAGAGGATGGAEAAAVTARGVGAP
jgi:hypothetical protein